MEKFSSQIISKRSLFGKMIWAIVEGQAFLLPLEYHLTPTDTDRLIHIHNMSSRVTPSYSLQTWESENFNLQQSFMQLS